MTRNTLFNVIPVAVFIIICLILFGGLFLNEDLPSARIGKPLPYFHIKTLDEKYIDSNDFKGHFSLINVWSTWCSNCLLEHDFLNSLAQDGVIIYGLNYKDDLQAAQNWLQENGNPYKAVGVDASGDLGIELGVYGTPETYLIDPTGKILMRYAGLLDNKSWKRFFVPKMQPHEESIK
ncbi:MAG: hypothetical protein A3F18_04485 [Legionellales bacterium RIFCSPHIGHO2_12_FULL_37_14]|nr:MAG: hypothetical protein A3F18_04485 [Legionellales bacterium RIFCSPHIGHO2_12_FULL_37_14]